MEFYLRYKSVKRKYMKKFLNIKPIDPNQKYSIICDIIDMV